MSHIATKIDNWQRNYTQAMPYATVAVLTLAVLAFHALFQFNAGLEPLYILPIWLSIRLLGARASILTVVGISLILTVAHPPMAGFTIPEVAAGLAIRLIGYSIIGLIINWFERSLREAKGLAFRDPLTGLLNRHGLAELRQRLFGPRNEETIVAVLDCDGFKQVNDRYGHSAGDHILQMLARILEHETRASDALVRMGGDEFVLILNSAKMSEARSVLERVQVLFDRYIQDAGYDCSISFGMVEQEPESNLDDVLAKADAAMYDHKNSKKHGYIN